jgi:hypothetical protein
MARKERITVFRRDFRGLEARSGALDMAVEYKWFSPELWQGQLFPENMTNA